MDDEPRLSREIGKVAFLFVKVALAFAIPITLLILLARNHLVLAIWLTYGLSITYMVVLYGYFNYQWKKKDWESRKQREHQEREWAEARERLRREAR